MKIGCLVSVREKSKRYPGKVLLDVCGEPLILQLLRRIDKAKEIDAVIMSTSTHADDNILAEIAEKNSFLVYRGSELDKIDRYYESAVKYDLDAVIIADGDDFFSFPEAIDITAKELKKNEYDCVSITGLPLGAVSPGATKNALKKVLELKDEVDTEVWARYITESDFFSTKRMTVENNLWNHPEIRLTLDYKEDYEFLTKVLSELGNNLDFTSDNLMDLLVNKKPELNEINAKVQQLYEEHITKAASVKFKK